MKPDELYAKRILISPLNWGMGHVSRCVPLIKNLLRQNNTIYIACDSVQREVFESYFNESITFLNHNGYPFLFKGKGFFIWDVFIRSSLLIKSYFSELKDIRTFHNDYSFDVVISDHRYGFRSDECTSIFLTHQLHLPLPWYAKFIQYFHKKMIDRFDVKWVVDDFKINLAGNLSSLNGFDNAYYVGLLSRFIFHNEVNEKIHQGVLIMSGPQAYAQSLLDEFKLELQSGEIDVILAAGSYRNIIETNGFLKLFRKSDKWIEADQILLKAKKIFGYFGYTTLMDVQFLKCEFNLVPCKGQLEQIYLSKLNYSFETKKDVKK